MAAKKPITARRIVNALTRRHSRAEVLGYLKCSESGFYDAIGRYPNAVLSAAHSARRKLIALQDSMCIASDDAGAIHSTAREILTIRESYCWQLYSRLVRAGHFSRDEWANTEWRRRPAQRTADPRQLELAS